MNFSDAIKEQLKLKNMTITELAHSMGYCVQHISDLLAGQRRWNETTINKACKALDLQIKFVSNNESDLAPTGTE